MAQNPQVENGATGQSTSNSPKIVEGWWKTAQKTGRIYCEYASAGVLDNSGVPELTDKPFERLVPDHLDVNDKNKWVWNAPYGITYYIFEGDETDKDGNKTGKKKHLIFRIPTKDYEKNGGGKSGGFKQYPQKKITEQTTVIQAISLDNKELTQDMEQTVQCTQVDFLMSAEGGAWQVPQTTEVPFKQVVLDPASRMLYIVYTLVHKESPVTSSTPTKK